MGIRKGAVDVIFVVGESGWSIEGVKWAIFSIARQDWPKWRVLIIDASRTDVVENLAEAILPEGSYKYARSSMKGDLTQSDLLYEAVCGAKAKYIAYAVPGISWPKDHLRRMVEQMEQGADVVMAGRKPRLTNLMHRLCHYERTFGFKRHSEGDPAQQIIHEFDRLKDTVWEPRIAKIKAGEPSLPPDFDVPFTPVNVKQLLLFQHA